MRLLQCVRTPGTMLTTPTRLCEGWISHAPLITLPIIAPLTAQGAVLCGALLCATLSPCMARHARSDRTMPDPIRLVRNATASLVTQSSLLCQAPRHGMHATSVKKTRRWLVWRTLTLYW